MINRLFLLSTVASFAFSGFAYAQESTTAEETDTPSANVTELDIGEPVPQEPSSADAGTYVKSTHGDWSVQCLRVEEGPEPCQMYQLLRDQNGGNVAEVSIFKLAGNSQVDAGGTFIVPLETLLTEKLNIQVDSGQAKRYDYSFCTTVGCYSRVGFTSEDVAAFRRGNVANITIVPALAPDQRVSVAMSLSGFTAAFEEITELEQARQQ